MICQKKGYDLENLVYYRGETHYFVMTAKKASLAAAGVLKNPNLDITHLLEPNNIDDSKLAEYVRGITVAFGLPATTEYIKDHSGKDCVQIFDFSVRKTLVSSSKIIESAGKSLLIGIIGDALVEPFWPEGLGINRGFLGALDFVWTLTQFGNVPNDRLLATRERLFDFMQQIHAAKINTTMQLDFNEYTFVPTSRYKISNF